MEVDRKAARPTLILRRDALEWEAAHRTRCRILVSGATRKGRRVTRRQIRPPCRCRSESSPASRSNRRAPEPHTCGGPSPLSGLSACPGLSVFVSTGSGVRRSACLALSLLVSRELGAGVRAACPYKSRIHEDIPCGWVPGEVCCFPAGAEPAGPKPPRACEQAPFQNPLFAAHTQHPLSKAVS